MSPPHPAQRRNGACYGSLYKQHSSVAVPPNLFMQYLRQQQDIGAQQITKGGGGSSTDGRGEKAAESLAAALDSNERGKSHDYCVLVGNIFTSYESFQCYRRGDHPIVRFLFSFLSSPFLHDAVDGRLRSSFSSRGMRL